MKRFVALLTTFMTLAACGALAQAQQPKKLARIGYIILFAGPSHE